MRRVLTDTASLMVLALSLGTIGCGNQNQPPTAGTQNQSNTSNTPARSLQWPADIKTTPQALKFEFESIDATRIRVKVVSLDRPTQLRISVGAVLKPLTRPDKVSDFVVWKPFERTFDSDGDYATIEVLRLSTEKWMTERTSDTFEPTGAETGNVVKWLTAAGELPWYKAQIGLWIVKHNCGLDALSGKQYSVTESMMGVSSSVTYRLYGYQAVKDTIPVLQKIGLNIDSYKMYAEIEADFQKHFKVFSETDWISKPNIASSGNLFSYIEDYRKEPAVEKLMVDYMTKHQNSYCRHEALRFTKEHDLLTAEGSALYEVASQSPSAELRVAAAMKLMKQGDLRGEALLVAHSGNKRLEGVFRGPLAHFVGKRTGNTEQVKIDETPLAFWERTGGWAALSAKHDAEKIKQVMADIRGEQDEEVKAIAASLKTADNKSIYKIMAELTRRYPNSPVALKAIQDVATTHKNKNVRYGALEKLRPFKKFDLSDYLISRLGEEKYDSALRMVMQLPWSTTLDGKKRLFFVAIKHDSHTVRSHAISGIQNELLTDPKVTLAILELMKADRRYRKSGLEKLVRYKTDQAIPAIEFVISLSEETDRNDIAEAMRQVGSSYVTPEGLEIVTGVLKTHSLPDARMYAMSALYRFQAAKIPVMKLVLEVYEKTDDGKLRANAVRVGGNAVRRNHEADIGMMLIRRGLTDKSAHARSAAYDCAKSYKLTELASLIAEQAAAEDDEKNRNTAYSALERLKYDGLFDILVAWLKTDNPKARRRAVYLMIRNFRDDPRTLEVLTSLKDDKDGTVKRDVTRFLERQQSG